MKNYMANKSFSRGVETLGAEASMVFVGNTSHTVPYMLKHSDLFMDLPDSYHDSAFLDRIHFYIPGWEADIIRGEMFSNGYGFVVDYLAEILRYLRNRDYSDKYQEHFTLSSDISTRDRDAINKTFSGLMKILYPKGEASKEEIQAILEFAIEGRKRVKDQLLRIDSTYSKVKFGFEDQNSNHKIIKTLEEQEYPVHYHHTFESDESVDEKVDINIEVNTQPTFKIIKDKDLSVEDTIGALLPLINTIPTDESKYDKEFIYKQKKINSFTRTLYTDLAIKEGYKNSTWVFACVKLRAQSVS